MMENVWEISPWNHLLSFPHQPYFFFFLLRPKHTSCYWETAKGKKGKVPPPPHLPSKHRCLLMNQLTNNRFTFPLPQLHTAMEKIKRSFLMVISISCITEQIHWAALLENVMFMKAFTLSFRYKNILSWSAGEGRRRREARPYLKKVILCSTEIFLDKAQEERSAQQYSTQTIFMIHLYHSVTEFSILIGQKVASLTVVPAAKFAPILICYPFYSKI